MRLIIRQIGVLLLLLLLFLNLVAEERSESFLVRMYSKRVKVLSPATFYSPLNILIENKTLVKIVGKVIIYPKREEHYVTIKPMKHVAVEVKAKKGDRIFFIPLAPAFQDIELIFGLQSYEIPPKR
jgi:hypothetical protein